MKGNPECIISLHSSASSFGLYEWRKMGRLPLDFFQLPMQDLNLFYVSNMNYIKK